MEAAVKAPSRRTAPRGSLVWIVCRTPDVMAVYNNSADAHDDLLQRPDGLDYLVEVWPVVGRQEADG